MESSDIKAWMVTLFLFGLIGLLVYGIYIKHFLAALFFICVLLGSIFIFVWGFKEWIRKTFF